MHRQSCCVLYFPRLENKLCSCYLVIFTQVHSYPNKYQIYLKSINGPMDVLLLNKRSVSSPPLVLSIPPPEDIFQNSRLVTSDDPDSDNPPCQPLVYPNPRSRFRNPAMKDLWSSYLIKAEPERPHGSGCEYCSLYSIKPKHYFLSISCVYINIKYFPPVQKISEEIEEIAKPTKGSVQWFNLKQMVVYMWFDHTRGVKPLARGPKPAHPSVWSNQHI